MDSWWDLGEGAGFSGQQLELHRITCPFCMERGNFAVAHAAAKRKANSSKVLHFDTLRCENCKGYVLVLWSAQEHGNSFHSLYNYRVLPWLLTFEQYPDHWPDDVGRYWLQAHRSLRDDNWDAAAVMARSALQNTLRLNGASGPNLRAEIEDMGSKGILPPIMIAWSHELRLIANESAHPGPGTVPVAAQDVRDVVEYLDFLLQYLFNLPHDIEQYRNRRGSSSS